MKKLDLSSLVAVTVLDSAALAGVTGGRGGHGENDPPISTCMFHAVETAGREVDRQFPAGRFSEEKRQKEFLLRRNRALANCPKAQGAKR